MYPATAFLNHGLSTLDFHDSTWILLFAAKYLLGKAGLLFDSDAVGADVGVCGG